MYGREGKRWWGQWGNLAKHAAHCSCNQMVVSIINLLLLLKLYPCKWLGHNLACTTSSESWTTQKSTCSAWRRQKNKILEETLNPKTLSTSSRTIIHHRCKFFWERHKYCQMLEEIPAVREEEGQKNKILEETLNPKAPSMNSTTFFHRFKNWGET